MYNVANFSLGKKLKFYRKAIHKTMLEVGEELHKSKATISKYESGEIIPDTITLLELCNCLNISLDELFSIEKTKNINYNFLNPFDSNKLYIYYYTDKKLILSIIDIYQENDILKCKFYNGIKNIDAYKKCCYYYEGVLEASKTTAYFSFNNNYSSNNMLEKVEIVLNISGSKEKALHKGLILGLTPNLLPIVKKIILSTYNIENIHKYDKFLTFSKEDIKKIHSEGALIIENKNYDEFFFND